MHNDGLLSLDIEYGCTFSNLSKAANDGCVNETYWLVNIRVINSRNQSSLGLFN